MGSAPLTRQILGPGLYIVLAGGLMLATLVPLTGGRSSLPGPDLLFCLTIGWVMRRPDLLPVGLVAAVALMGDLLLQRPPGLWAALLVLATEHMRARSLPGQAPSLWGEGALVGGLFAAMVVVNWTLLAIFMVPRPSLAAVLLQVPATLIAYPVVVLLLSSVFGIRRPSEAAGKLGAGRV